MLALEDADWFTPSDSSALAAASLALVDRVLSRLCDRLAYLLRDHLRLVDADEAAPPAVERPVAWWVARGWADTSNGIVVRPRGDA